jgi:DNA replication protein DnaC
MLEEPDSDRLRQQYPSLWADPNKTCITCQFHITGEKTFRWWSEDRTEIVTWECNCISQWIMHRYMLQHGIGKAYQRLALADAVSVPEKTQMEVFQYLDNADRFVERGVNLILHSPDAGTGKTLMLMLSAKNLLARGFDVFVAQMNSIVELYTSGWRDKADKDYFEQRIMNCQILKVDDLGKETGQNHIDFIDRLLDRVFRHRTAASLPTFITGNFTREQIEKGYGKYVASLLTETCIFVETSGVDWRPQAQVRTQEELLQGVTRPLVIA